MLALRFTGRLSLRSTAFHANRIVTDKVLGKAFVWRASKNLKTFPLHTQTRFHSSHESNNSASNNIASLKVDKPTYLIAFTCNVCETRSSHSMSKQAYSRGTVLIQCPKCRNRHLIADHLKIFSDDRITIEDILAQKGDSVSSSTDDLVFEDIPENLKGLLGRHAKDAPAEYREESASEESPLIEDGSQNKK